jgi:hypothetical protein
MITQNIEEVAAHFKVTSRTIFRWIGRGMPRLSGGYFDMGRIELWLKSEKGQEKGFRLEPEEAEILFLEGVQEVERGLITIFRALELSAGERVLGSGILKKFLAFLPRPTFGERGGGRASRL